MAASVACLFFACGDDAGRKLGIEGSGGEEAGGAGNGGEGAGAACGDGRRSGDEECDDGNADSGDGCADDCHIEPGSPACGDGEVGDDEECDDGNADSGDGCDERCRDERCGNRRIDAGEECDPPASGLCTASCVRFSPNCGDGSVQEDEGEQCDDENDDPNDGCHDCRRQCGNGRIDRALGEECDPSLSTAEHCSDACKWLPVCGDGVVQESRGEECDPSNGRTCVECKNRDPGSCNGGAGGAPSSGCGGSGGATDCVPLGGGSELLQNGGFDTNFVGWIPHASSVTLLSANDGSPAPKSLEVGFAQGPVRAISGAYQCIPILPGRTYQFSARYQIPSDAPEGVAAALTALVYAGTRCEGPFLAPAGSGPQGTARDAWTPYQATLSSTILPASSGEGRMLVRLGVIRPPNVSGARVFWDSASVSEEGATCGNCVVDAHETCDDGNQTSGDGCSPTCRLEACGDGVQDGAEQCDDGNAVFGEGDDCTPSCRNPSDCDTCAVAACAEEADACLGLAGVAEAGRRAGTALSTLCDELRTCAHESACHLATRTTEGIAGRFLENCYCGTAGTGCFDTPGRANGSCRAEVEAALESASPVAIKSRMSGSMSAYPVFGALKELLTCEGAACAASCVPTPTCGDGVIQDRNLEFTFIIDGEEVACSDDYTSTGRGCSFEECDDGNDDPGDGCDEHCFLEVCGNHVTQADEQCDDGNDDPDDGCNLECESTCGNMVVDGQEQCDPPGGTHMCTEAEFASNPSQCACDNRCKRIVCGNDIVQRPAEQCDPPADGTCNADCTFADQGPCEACINMDEGLRAFNEVYCLDDDACIAVKQCVIREADCYGPIPAACYCGELEDQALCRSPTFTPTGPCRVEVLAGAGDDEPDNSTVLDRMTNPDFPTGAAFLLLDEASRLCPDVCPDPSD